MWLCAKEKQKYQMRPNFPLEFESKDPEKCAGPVLFHNLEHGRFDFKLKHHGLRDGHMPHMVSIWLPCWRISHIIFIIVAVDGHPMVHVLGVVEIHVAVETFRSLIARFFSSHPCFLPWL